jgi:hypothetical protein
MVRYTRRYTNTPSTPTPNQNPQTNLLWKSLPIIGLILLATGSLGAITLLQFTNQKIIHIRADDTSRSAKEYTEQRLQHCQASVQYYKPGDKAITISFADRAVTTHNISINNSLSSLGQCQDTSSSIANKNNGTSLILLLERIQNVAQKERSRNKSNPIVATIIIQSAEPGENQPELDFDRVKKLVHNIISEQGEIAFMVEDLELKNQLEDRLVSETNTQVCQLKDVKNCVDWAFKTVR